MTLFPPRPNSIISRNHEKTVGGSNRKYVLVDDTRKEWLFKPQSDLQILIDQAASATAIRAGVATPVVYAYEYDDPVLGALRGTIQPLLDCDKQELSQKMDELTHVQREALQRHQVVDRLLANADPHRKQFVILHEGTLVAVDKSQSMRWFPHDPLVWNVKPWPVRTRHAVYWHLRRGALRGHYILHPSTAIDFAQQISLSVSAPWLISVWKPIFNLWRPLRLCWAAQRDGRRKELIDVLVKALEQRLADLPSEFAHLYRLRGI